MTRALEGRRLPDVTLRAKLVQESSFTAGNTGCSLTA
jgi:hypothetical protein